MMDPTPCLFISRPRAALFYPAAVDHLTDGKGRAVVVGPVRDRADMGFQVRVYGPGLPPRGRTVTHDDLSRMGIH